jgi:hypothetical protein
MPELKWKSFIEASPDREYLALISYLPLKNLWALPKFVSYTLAIHNQLKESHGLRIISSGAYLTG